MKYHCASCKREAGEPEEGIVQVGLNPKTRKPTFIKYTNCTCGVVTYRHPDGRQGVYNPGTGKLRMKDKFTP